MKDKQVFFEASQKGAATVFTAVVILVIMTLVMIFAAKVSLQEQRVAANEVRHKEAFAVAEAGLDYTAERFADEFRRLYDGSDSTTTLLTVLNNSQVPNPRNINGGVAQSGEPSFTAQVSQEASVFAGIPVYTVSSTGTGADGSGTAVASRQITMANVFGGANPDVPVVVSGVVGTGGNFDIVANPNGGGPGVPVSIWSNDTIEVDGSAATCYEEFFTGNNPSCANPSDSTKLLTKGENPGTAIDTYDPTKPDLLPNDPDFPDDLFAFVFNTPREDWQSKKAQAASYGQAVDSCADIKTAGTDAGSTFPLWWVSGDCDLRNGTYGSLDEPVIVVVENSELSMNGNTELFGITFVFDRDLSNPDDDPSASLTGTPTITGSFISDVGGNKMSGNYKVVYNPVLFDNFTNAGNTYSLAYLPATWRDF